MYLHSLVGSRSDLRLALQTRVKRDVNRMPLDLEILTKNLAHPGSKLNLLSIILGRLLITRIQHAGFHPNGEQRVLSLGDEVFALLRVSPAGDEHILCLTNITAHSLERPDRRARLAWHGGKAAFAVVSLRSTVAFPLS